MDAEQVGAHVNHHTKEETFAIFRFYRIVEANGHLRLKTGVLRVYGLKRRESRAHSDFGICHGGHLSVWLHVHSVLSEIQQEK